MDETWSTEPDIEELRRLHAMLNTDPAAAVHGFRQLAERGSLMSMVYLAHACAKGLGIEVDLPESERWYRRAVNGGSALASYELGRNLLERREFPEAREMFLKGVAVQYSPSLHMMALMELRGQGGPANLTIARDLLEKAVARGHVFSKRNLGLLLMTGQFGLYQVVRGAFLLLASIKDVIFSSRDPMGDRLR